ncbi:hypothetical protein C0Q70_19768 [Pomacea canaliculata]|uniref:Uncharacterized protein n=1 Tax=Pomacea canaliculata TaxID=400727 RepID=A0A2T7NDR2_POMCA|nr:hypothetical protein C0Q70_19768 [Pomacea canaliculata]
MEGEQHEKEALPREDIAPPTSQTAPPTSHTAPPTSQAAQHTNQATQSTSRTTLSQSQTALSTCQQTPLSTCQQTPVSTSQTVHVTSQRDGSFRTVPVSRVPPFPLRSGEGCTIYRGGALHSRHLPPPPPVVGGLLYSSYPGSVLQPAPSSLSLPQASAPQALMSPPAMTMYSSQLQHTDISYQLQSYSPPFLYQQQFHPTASPSRSPRLLNIQWTASVAPFPEDMESAQLPPAAVEQVQMVLVQPQNVFPSSAAVSPMAVFEADLMSVQDTQYVMSEPGLPTQPFVCPADVSQEPDTRQEGTPSFSSPEGWPISSSRLRAESKEFIPKTHQQQIQFHLATVPPFKMSVSPTRLTPEHQADMYTQAFRLMESYAQKILRPDFEQRVLRVPATNFNEQKLEPVHTGGYLLLGMPQTPALRGQEALSRVCCALENILRLRARLAVIISNYKYKECYLRRAPFDVFPRPSSEGSHDILMFGVDIGVVCIQVTCVERGTSKGTVKKQIRDTLKQLRKDEEAVRSLLQDLPLPHLSVVRVLALPNLSQQELRQKLETRMLKKLASMFGSGDNLEGVITSDHLPLQGHRHFPDKASHDLLQQWLNQAAGRGSPLPINVCMQMFARYTSEWSVPEVWTLEKPRVEVRTLSDAAIETSHRYGLQVLTPEQEALLNTPKSHVMIIGVPGSGATLVLQLKVRQWLQHGACVAVFIPQRLTGLWQAYQAADLFQTFRSKVLLWTGRKLDGEGVWCTSLEGEEVDVSQQQGGAMLAVFDGADYDIPLVSFAVERATTMFASVWIAAFKSLPVDTRIHGYNEVRLTKVTRIPTSIQALLRHGLQAILDEQPASTFLSACNANNFSASESDSILSPADEPVPPSILSPRVTLDEVSCYVEASSDNGFACDGPTPVIIFHPPHCSPHSRVCDCRICCRELARVLQELGQLDPPSDEQERTCDGDDKDEADNEDDDKHRKHGRRCHVPHNVVVFTDTADDAARLVRSLQTHGVVKEQLLGSMHQLHDIPRMVGREVALVVYAGEVKVSKGRVLLGLVAHLREVMSLCQGHLVLVLEVRWLPRSGGSPEDEEGQGLQMKPFELELQLLMEESERQHLVEVAAVNTASEGGAVNTASEGGAVNTASEGGAVNTASEGGAVNIVSEGGAVNTASEVAAVNTASEGGAVNTVSEDYPD